MRRKGKEETDRFMQAIAAFSAAPEEITPRGRRLQRSEQGVLQAILIEIDETVLRRHLAFTTAHDAKLILDVGERRLLAAVSMPMGMDFVHENLVGRPLEDEDAAAVLSMLSEFTSSEKEVYVSSDLSAESEAGAFGGLAASGLMAHEGIAVLRGLPDVLIHAIEVSKKQCRAVVVLRSGQALLRHGDAELCERLVKNKSRNASNESPRCDIAFWHAGPLSEDAILLAQADEVLIAIAGAREQVETLFKTWRKAVTA